MALPGYLLAASSVITFTAKKPVAIVNLAANRTTGFQWFLTKQPRWLKVISAQYIPKKVAKGIVGSGGLSVWKFKLISNLQGARLDKICWRYTRSWAPAGKDKCQKVIYSP